jgi:hypothetical protein
MIAKVEKSWADSLKFEPVIIQTVWLRKKVGKEP